MFTRHIATLSLRSGALIVWTLSYFGQATGREIDWSINEGLLIFWERFWEERRKGGDGKYIDGWKMGDRNIKFAFMNIIVVYVCGCLDGLSMNRFSRLGICGKPIQSNISTYFPLSF